MDVVERLLAAGADANHALPDDGSTPLHVAIGGVQQMLLATSSDVPRCVSPPPPPSPQGTMRGYDVAGTMFLSLPIEEGHLDVMEQLIVAGM